MQTFDQSIFSLYEQKHISYEEALRWCSNVDEFKLKVQGISTTAEMARDQMARTGMSTPGTKPAPAPAPAAKPVITRFGS